MVLTNLFNTGIKNWMLLYHPKVMIDEIKAHAYSQRTVKTTHILILYVDNMLIVGPSLAMTFFFLANKMSENHCVSLSQNVPT